MSKTTRLLGPLLLFLSSAGLLADSLESTRVLDLDQHAACDSRGNALRQKSDYVLKELDLQPGDIVVDVGAGDGWWAGRFAEQVGEQGLVHASEVEQKKVDGMKDRLVDRPNIRPYLSPTDGTDLPVDSCDLAFLSKVYHHLEKDGHVDYLKHLKQVVKPTGRLCIIERYPEIRPNDSSSAHGWSLSLLVEQAERAGWIPVRCELMTGTEHYIAIFVQRELFAPEKE